MIKNYLLSSLSSNFELKDVARRRFIPPRPLDLFSKIIQTNNCEETYCSIIFCISIPACLVSYF